MALYRFRDTTYLLYKNNGFVWESEWNCFRPITSFAWNGKTFAIDDREYCKDPSDPLYGFGSAKMKEVCDLLTSKYASLVPSATRVKTPLVGPVEWWVDRQISIHPCAPRDRTSWKRMHCGKYYTPRKAPRNRLTRRNRESKHNES